MGQLQQDLRSKNTALASPADLPPSGRRTSGYYLVMTRLASSSSSSSIPYDSSKSVESDTGQAIMEMGCTGASSTTRSNLSQSFATTADTTMETTFDNFPVF